MSIYKFLHIFFMFGAVTMFIGGEVMLAMAGRARDVPAIRRLAHITEKTDGIGILMFVLGIGAGFVTAATGNIDFTAPWLIIAYVLVGALLLAGPLFFLPRGKRLIAAADASPVDTPSPQLSALIDPGKMRAVMIVDIAVWTSVIFVMVVKPFS